MKRRWLHWTLGSIGALLLLVVLSVLWILNTQTGTRSALGFAQSAMDGKLSIETVNGSIAGPLTLDGLRYADSASGLDVYVKRIHLDPALLDLFGLRVRVVNAEVQGVDVTLSEASEPPPEPETGKPFTLEAPIDLVIERFALRDAVVRQAEAEMVRIDSAAFAGSWIETNVTVKALDVQSPDGEIHFAGAVREADTYIGDGAGEFRWQVGDSTYAGTIKANAQATEATIDVVLTAPLRADLNLGLEQQDTLPWKFVLAVPSFDPRKELMPDSSFESLAANLHGAGTLERGVAQGEVVINGEPLRFERLAFERDAESVALALQMLLGGGKLDAEGDIRLAAEPVAAKVDAQWSEITVPEQWAGQVLRTEGTLAFDGSAESYRANGRVRLGPPDRIADIELNVQGSPSAVNLQQFDIVQPDGRLAASGTVDLEPRIGWSLSASASSFDPGAFVTEWPGDLSFDLKTSGALEEEGPTASVLLSDLRGKLRGRAISGHADVELASNKNLSGEADLRSGASRLRLNAKPGDAMDAIARIEIPALDDWVPDAGGALHGTFSALGKWPHLAIDGQARGTDLRFGDMRAQSLRLNIDVENPTAPEGFVVLRLREAVAAGMEIASLRANASGMEIASLRANASGNAESHTLELSMQGAPLGTELSVEGALADAGWTGTVDQLVLDIKDAARLELQQPVQVEYLEQGTRVSQACFADGDIRLCVEGAMRADGSLEARYSLAEVPLALANAFASADSTLAFAGTLGGEGDVQRNAEGVLSGYARIESTRV
jgi:translocation and assembly module TamB